MPIGIRRRHMQASIESEENNFHQLFRFFVIRCAAAQEEGIHRGAMPVEQISCCRMQWQSGRWLVDMCLNATQKKLFRYIRE